MRNFCKSLAEFLPLILFFIIFKKYDLFLATGVLVISSFISLAFIYFLTKKLALMPLISALLVGIFGGLTWFLHDDIFIKLKPTILNVLFALVLWGGVAFKKPFLKYLFDGVFAMEDKYWFILAKRWGLFFIFLAIVNEVIWRNYPEEFWVSFKVFGMLPLSLVFTLSQAPFMLKHQR
jgi:intracellular septation protein